jgi:hypothetical protein
MPCGYDRVSKLDQDLSIQLDALIAAGCTMARSKEVSRTTADGVRTALLECMKARPIILARAVRDRQNIIAASIKGARDESAASGHDGGGRDGYGGSWSGR